MLLAETYIHVEFSRDIRFDALAKRLEDNVVSLAKEIYVREIKIEYVLEDGTLIERARIFKALIYIIGAIAGYHELRESVIDLYEDAQKFGNLAIERFHDLTDTKPSAVIYKRKIPADVNRLYRIIQNTDLIQGSDLSRPDYGRATADIVSDLAQLHVSNPDDDGVRVLLNNLPKKKIPELPNTVAAAVQMNERRKRSTEPLTDRLGFSRAPPRGRRRRRRYAHTTTI